MNDLFARKSHAWLAAISALVIVVMLGVLFMQVRYIAEQNHQLHYDNERLAEELENAKSSRDIVVASLIKELDRGLPLVLEPQVNSLKFSTEMDGQIVGALTRQLKDDRDYVRHYGLKGLLAINLNKDRLDVFAPMVVPYLIPLLQEERLRDDTVSLLFHYRKRAAAAAPVVLETADATPWNKVTSAISHAQAMDPKCDIVPLLTRHIRESKESWKVTLERLERGYSIPMVAKAYQQAAEATTDAALRKRYRGIVRYLNSFPPEGKLEWRPDVEEFIE
ncbi:hypothetical protein ACYFX5_14440 [Bremerella sp. T1]|uniref:hypothetical protein n=1 Tax=Bremerella sp. TYQ1 TaxID=3119568 RepID=UPI001CCB4FFB|nr:hypothetical protein [Bremerella volcania]UBM34253.1 hypothetical protein LA756_16390 [Bremerella volcania]